MAAKPTDNRPSRKSVKLSELLASFDSQRHSQAERSWDDIPVGKETL